MSTTQTINESSQTKKNNKVFDASLLFVDDEKNILSSLKRLFRPLGYKIFLANSGAEGLEILNQQSIDLVISDMRMPEMDGAEFLEKVTTQWPDTVRLLLTGYADISSTIAAINKGKITQYISKPWDENDLKITVEKSLKFKFLEQERDELLRITHRQNEELKEFNTNLEGLVKTRTNELEQTMDMLDTAFQTLKSAYSDTIKVFSNLIELREGANKGSSKEVSSQSQNLALAMGLNKEQAEQISYAGMLRNIGKMGFSDAIFNTPVEEMSSKVKTQYHKHPILGEAILMTIEPLKSAAKIIRHYREKNNGSGFPDKLSGDNIPLGSRILSVVNDYYALQKGLLTPDIKTPDQALTYIVSKSDTFYDPEVVSFFVKQFAQHKDVSINENIQSFKIQSSSLKAGMVLARDIQTNEGVLLLAGGFKLGQHTIKHIINLEAMLNETLEIYIKI